MTIRDKLDSGDCLLFDGAIGTQTYLRGIPKGHCYDELNVSMPDIIREIHLAYLQAGAQILTTNTFGANRFILEEYYDLGDKIREINYYGARIARQAAHGRAAVAGSIGPISRPLDSEKKISRTEVPKLIEEQAEALLDGGADLILLETFADLEELRLGIRTVRALHPELVIIAEMSFPNNGLTLFGMNPYEVAQMLHTSGADVIGSNCGTGPQSVFETVRKMGSITDKSLSAMPNAGLAQFAQGKFYYPFNPDYFARYGRKLLEAGVQVLGGCCGTTPDHIRSLKAHIQDAKPGPRTLKSRTVSVKGKTPTRKEEKISSPLKNQLERGGILALEVDPPKDPDITRFLRKLESYAPFVQIINVSDSPMARPRMSPIAVGKLILDLLKKETIIHYTCRDRNILGIQSDLLGASALSLDNFLALGGDPPSIGDYPFATGVYDLTSEGLVEMMSALNRGIDLLGNPIGKQTGFLIGVGLGIGRDEEKEIRAAEAKRSKGAHFVITQPIFDVERSRKTLQALEEAGIPVIAGVMPLISHKNAEYIHYEIPGIEIPQRYLSRMENAKGREGEKEGVLIAREIVAELSPLCKGLLFMPPLGRYRLLEDILG